MIKQREISETAEMLRIADLRIAEKVLLSSGQPLRNNINDINDQAEAGPLFGQYGLYHLANVNCPEAAVNQGIKPTCLSQVE